MTKFIFSTSLLLALISQGIFLIAIEHAPATAQSLDIDTFDRVPADNLIAAAKKKKKAKIRQKPKPPITRENTAQPIQTSPNPAPPPPPVSNETPQSQSPPPGTISAPAPTSRIAPPQNNKIRWGTNLESYYFNWSDNFGNSGNQFVLPLTVTANSGNWDVGVRSAWINSNFDGVLILDGQRIGTRKGAVSTLSDTSVSVAYTFKESDWPIRLNLDLNLPTGKATLVGSEKNAIMDGSLVQQTRFGEGLNIAPGISVSRALSDKDTIGFGASYIMRGAFNPLGDVPNSGIDPGDEAVATLQYQRNDRNLFLGGGLIYTNYGVTKRNNQNYYRNGDRLDANVTGVYALSPGNRVQVNARYFTQTPNEVVNFFTGDFAKESRNSNGNALYLGLDWGIATDREQRGTVHFLADYLTVQANSYDRINDLYNGGRDKYSIGVGYDYALNNSSRASVQAKYFFSNDKATPATNNQDIRSSGLNLFGSVSFDF